VAGEVKLYREIWSGGREVWVYRDSQGRFAKPPHGAVKPAGVKTLLYEYTLYVKYPQSSKNREINWEFRYYSKRKIRSEQKFIDYAIGVLSNDYNLHRTLPACDITLGVERLKAAKTLQGKYIVYDKAAGRMLKSW
jgi:hypothetical protein